MGLARAGLATDGPSRAFAALLFTLLPACGGDPITPDASALVDSAPRADAGGEASFLFEIELTESRSAEAGTVAPYASVYNPWSSDGAWVEALRVGDCVFNEALLETCDPPCELPDVCQVDGTCAPPVARRSAGPIEVTGLTSALLLTPQDPQDYYTASFNPEPAEGQLFGEGDSITANATGASVPAFTVTTTGVADLITDLPCELPLDGTEDLELTWTPATQGDPITFVLQSGNHGAQFSSVVCETDDSGSLVVDASLVAAYLGGFHPLQRWTLTRSSEGATSIDDVRVELRARSSVGCQW